MKNKIFPIFEEIKFENLLGTFVIFVNYST